MATKLKTVENEIDARDRDSAEKMRIWNAVCKTDPKHTKAVEFGRKFTAIDAHYQIQEATRLFGPIGEGWGYDTGEIAFEDGLVIVPVTLWHGSRERSFGPLYGSTTLRDRKGNIDKDAPKKATTDALTKGLSQLGFNADVFLGKFDDNKYVAEVTAEFHPKPGNPQTGETGERIRTGEPAAREKLDGPHTSKTALKAAIAKVVRAVEVCESLEAIDTVKTDNKRSINQALRDWPELLDGDPSCAEDIGLKGTIAKKRAELDTTLGFQLLMSNLEECTSANELTALLTAHGDAIGELDGEEARRFEDRYNELETGLKAVALVRA